MILKETDNKDAQIAELESLLVAPGVPADTKALIERELKILRAGIKGERESAYDIDFYSGAHENRVVIHDLRIEHQGRVAQIDHLILNRLLEVFVLETKHFTEGVSINEQGEFSIWFGGKPRGIPSPLGQNDRHIAVLKDVFKTLKMPTRLGIRLQPTFESLVLVSKNARIGRPKKFNTDTVMKSDQFETWMEKNLNSTSPLQMAKLVGVETLQGIARQLVALHRTLVPNYRTRFGVTEELLCPPATSRPARTAAPEETVQAEASVSTPASEKLTTSKLAQKLGIRTAELTDRLVASGLLELREGKTYVTAKGKATGGEFRMNPKFGPYFLWPAELTP